MAAEVTAEAAVRTVAEEVASTGEAEARTRAGQRCAVAPTVDAPIRTAAGEPRFRVMAARTVAARADILRAREAHTATAVRGLTVRTITALLALAHPMG